MKKMLLALFLPLMLAAAVPQPLARYDFSQVKNGIVPNLSGKYWPAKIKGKYRVTAQNALEMDGKTTTVILEGTEKFNPASGMTFTLLYKRLEKPDNNAENQHHDAFFYKDRQFAFTRRGKVIYVNFQGPDRKWAGATLSSDVFQPGDSDFHHVAMTIVHKKDTEMGIDQTEIRLYFDGLPVGFKTFRNTAPCDRNAPIEIGCGYTFGAPWKIGGEIAEPMIFDRVLSPAEIRELVGSQSLARPGFRLPRKLAEKDWILLKKFDQKPEIKQALLNLALDQDLAFDWRKAALAPERYLKVLPGKESTLTLLTVPGSARIASWYDQKSQRELLNWENSFYRIALFQKGREAYRSPGDKGVKNTLKSLKNVDGSHRFVISSGSQDWQAEADFTFSADRLEWRVNNLKSSLPLRKIVSPALNLKPLKSGRDHLLIPFECGRILSDAGKNNTVYHGNYPGCNATMQMGALYDRQGGVFVSSGDPDIRMQKLSFSVTSGGSHFNFDRVLVPGGQDSGRATAELFRGDWYDAGWCYRRLLERIKAPWWQRKAAGKGTPEWLKKNTLWVRYDYPNEYLAPYRQLREFFDMPFAVHVEGWHERGGKYSLDLPPLPSFLDDVRELQQLGLRVQTYHNGRILQKFDRRGKETVFSKKIASSIVRQQGKMVNENYPDTFGPSFVLCPQTPLYQKLIFDICVRMTTNGLDGVYLDQIGCTTPKLCSSNHHGHTPLDPDAWYRNGQFKALLAVREYWKQNKIEKWISTESNAESCVRICDMMTPWRWVYDDQVPLFQMIYSGRTQFADRNRVKEEPEAAFVKNAEQIAWGEQMGRLNNRSLCSPLRFDYRLFVKRLMYLRKGMLDFFNDGTMARPPRFVKDWPLIPRRWGMFGSKVLSRPPVISSAWKNKQNACAVILINTTDPTQSNEIYFPENAPAGVTVYSSLQGKTQQKLSASGTYRFTLEPRGCMVLTNKADAALNRAFEVIKKAALQPDPMAFDAAAIPYPRLLVPGKFYPALKATVICNANKNYAGNEINYIYFSVVYPGSIDLGNENKVREITLELSAPDISGDGIIRIFADKVVPENLVAEVVIAENFRTGSWREFKKLSVKTLKKLSGKQRLLFCFYGSSMCNFRSWKIQ